MLSNNWITTYPSRFETKLDAPKPLYKTGSSCSFTLHSCNPSTAFASPALDYPAPLFTIVQCTVQRPRASREDPAVQPWGSSREEPAVRSQPWGASREEPDVRSQTWGSAGRLTHRCCWDRLDTQVWGKYSWRFNTQMSYIVHVFIKHNVCILLMPTCSISI